MAPSAMPKGYASALGVRQTPQSRDPYVISSKTKRGRIYANLAKIAQNLCEEVSANLAKLAKARSWRNFRETSANPSRNFAK